MAGSNSNYERGEMEITSQKGTFSGFMFGTIYGGAAIAVILIFPILMFAVGLGWFPSLVASIVVGFLIGIGLKMNATWYASLIGLGIVTGIVSWLVTTFF